MILELKAHETRNFAVGNDHPVLLHSTRIHPTLGFLDLHSCSLSDVCKCCKTKATLEINCLGKLLPQRHRTGRHQNSSSHLEWQSSQWPRGKPGQKPGALGPQVTEQPAARSPACNGTSVYCTANHEPCPPPTVTHCLLL